MAGKKIRDYPLRDARTYIAGPGAGLESTSQCVEKKKKKASSGIGSITAGPGGGVLVLFQTQGCEIW